MSTSKGRRKTTSQRKNDNASRAPGSRTGAGSPTPLPQGKPNGPAANDGGAVGTREPMASGDTKVFLSYARDDDKAFDVVFPFRDLLRKLVHAKTGRTLAIFVDQANIRWGEDWRSRLSDEVLGASIFIPLLSASYLESRNCREEFNQFNSAATSLGVSELLLPVLIFRAPDIFHDDSTDEIVKTAMALQYEVIEEAVLSDRGSSEWLRTMSRLADSFARVTKTAEQSLLSRPPLLNTESPNDRKIQVADEVDEPGVTDLMVSLENNLAEMTSCTQALDSAMTALGEGAASIGKLPSNATARDAQLWSFKAAEALKKPGLEIERSGTNLFEYTRALDEDVRRLRVLAKEFPDLSDSLDSALSQMQGLEQVKDQMSSLLESLKPGEMLSVALRKAIRPSRSGLTKITDAIDLIEGWQELHNRE